MLRNDLNELNAFLAVAEEQSFTRAATRLQTSQSSLSQTIRRLEARLGVRLLARTTRSVSTTEAGEELLNTLRPAFDDIENRLQVLGTMRDKPAGTVRITTSHHAAEAFIWPSIVDVLPLYPDIKLELITDPVLTNIVADRFDAGVRLGEQVDRDMVAVKISPDVRMIVIGSPSYLENNPRPTLPSELTQHNCINIRLPTSGALYAWEFAKDGREMRVKVEGPLVFNNMQMALNACLAGCGLAFVFEDMAHELINTGKLIRLMDEWCPYFSGYHLYYPRNRQQSPAFRVIVNALKIILPSMKT